MTRYDASRLQELIKRHAQYTGSVLAQNILAHWHQYLPKFRKVMPLEYRRALLEMQAKQDKQAA